MCLIKVAYFQMYTNFHVEFMVNYKRRRGLYEIVWVESGNVIFTYENII